MWAGYSEFRLPSSLEGAPKNGCQVSSLELKVGAQAGQVTNFSMHAQAKVGHKNWSLLAKIGHFVGGAPSADWQHWSEKVKSNG